MNKNVPVVKSTYMFPSGKSFRCHSCRQINESYVKPKAKTKNNKWDFKKKINGKWYFLLTSHKYKRMADKHAKETRLKSHYRVSRITDNTKINKYGLYYLPK